MVTALTLEENEKKYFPAGKIGRVVCAGKEGTRKIIAGIDGHTVHEQTLRARRFLEIVPGHGEIWVIVRFDAVISPVGIERWEESWGCIVLLGGALRPAVPIVRCTQNDRGACMHAGIASVVVFCGA